MTLGVTGAQGSLAELAGTSDSQRPGRKGSRAQGLGNLGAKIQTGEAGHENRHEQQQKNLSS